jgi:hypothetical protein
MTDLNTQHHGHIVIGLREEASSGDSTCSQLAEEAADYIELLEYHLRCDRTWQSRAEKLEAALREIENEINSPDDDFPLAFGCMRMIINKALEGKDDVAG